MDLVVRCHQLPKRGETRSAISLSEICGGKGANQAVAAARAGGHVAMIGRVGDDAFAQSMRANLEQAHIDCESVRMTSQQSSGMAIVSVEDSGENSILVIPGANSQLSVDDVRQSAAIIQSAECLLLQLETPVETAIEAIAIARQAGVRVILNPAPVPTHWTERLLQVDLICPNQSEAEQISGVTINTDAATEQAAQSLRMRGAQHVIITLGNRGVAALIDDRFQIVPALSVAVVDTTAAGDAFAGAIAVRWAETNDLQESIRFASAAGALAVSRIGAQPSLPVRAEILQLLSDNPHL